MDIVTKIIAGGPGRRTRFHTEQNELILMSGFAALPTVMAQWLRTRLTGTRPEAPWWPLAVIPVIERHLSKDSNVIEFGSGSSTIWLAKRARCVVSLEDDELWHRKTLHRLKQAGLQNSEVLFRVDEGYYRLEGVDPDQQFDLAVSGSPDLSLNSGRHMPTVTTVRRAVPNSRVTPCVKIPC